tara:strand:+ start:1149 stop:1325 length:177 start_codon:yes stop_codon:yes gene_type:complete
VLGEGDTFLSQLAAMAKTSKVPVEFLVAQDLPLDSSLGIHGCLAALLDAAIERNGYRR